MQALIQRTRRALAGESGMTLIEIVIVLVIISVMAMLAVPRVSSFLGGSRREDFVIFTGMIAKTYDDSFLNDRTNYLVIHLNEGTPEPSELNKDVFSRHNGLSVVNLVDGNSSLQPAASCVTGNSRVLPYRGSDTFHRRQQ